MPSQDAQNPPNTSRQLSNSISFAPSPTESLPSSVQKQRVPRFAVGQGRLGPRNSSHGKNINRLGKATPGRPVDTSTSPRATGHVKRNLSNIQLTRNVSATALRKNQSETSLKRNNRSNGQLTKLARAASTRNTSKTMKRNRSLQIPNQTRADDGTSKPTVRFDVGNSVEDGDEEVGEEEGAWENYTDSRSPSTTRSSTPRRNSTITSPSKPDQTQKEGNNDPPNISTDKLRQDPGTRPVLPSRNAQAQSTPHLNNSVIQHHRPKPPDADRITSRLLRRNVSFNAPPQITPNSVTSTFIGSNGPGSVSSTTLNDNSNPEVISRFLNQPSSSTTPHDSAFLPVSTKNSPEKADQEESRDPDAEELPRRNKSLSDVAAMRISRTQQKLNLERESVVREPQNGWVPPPSVVRASRFPKDNIPFNIPFYNVSNGTVDGRMHPQLRHLFDQTNVEYRRVRMYQNPLVEAIGRLEAQGLVPRMRIAARQRSGRKGGLLNGSGDGTHGLSQSWRSHRSSKSVDAKDKAGVKEAAQMNGHIRRPRVMFQGIDNGEEPANEVSHSLDGQQELGEREHGRSQQEEARGLCRRLWKKHDNDE